MDVFVIAECQEFVKRPVVKMWCLASGQIYSHCFKINALAVYRCSDYQCRL